MSSNTIDTSTNDEGQETTTTIDVAKEKRRIWKNVIVISLGFFLTFNAFQGLSRLQSSLHRVDGMGVINSSVLYASLVISCLFVPKLMTRAIGYKWTIPFCLIFYILWMAANGYAVWLTMLPTSILVGIAAAPLWIAQCSYFTKIARQYARLDNKETEDTVISRFFGIFFMFFQLASLTGSVISFTVLKTTAHVTNVTNGYMADHCGRNDCPWNGGDNQNLDSPDSRTVWTLLYVYIGISVAAVIMLAVFVDPLSGEESSSDGKTVCQEIGVLMKSTVLHLKNRTQLLLIPLTIYSGLEQGFLNAEFNKSYVACSVGIWKVGLVMLPYGCVDAITSYVNGHVVKYTGRVPIFFAGALCDICIQVTLSVYSPSNTNHYALFIIAGMWGFSDGIWQTQINSLYGSVFSNNNEAGFANYRLWESIGFMLAFAYSNYLCTSVKLYILITFLALGMTGYSIVEILARKQSRKTKEITPAINMELQHSKN